MTKNTDFPTKVETGNDAKSRKKESSGGGSKRKPPCIFVAGHTNTEHCALLVFY